MSIKIGSTYNLPPVTDAAPATTTTTTSTATGSGAARGTTAAAGTAGAAEDKATLSAAGAQISALAGSPDFDQAKVDAIRQAIREGRFSVNAEAIADRLIYEASALLGPRTH